LPLQRPSRTAQDKSLGIAIRQIVQIGHPIPGISAILARMLELDYISLIDLEGITMREVQLREAKASLSAMVEEVAHGEAAVITRHGRKTAVLVGYDEWQRLNQVPSFASCLPSFPAKVP
jgi:antitoxin Phd